MPKMKSKAARPSDSKSGQRIVKRSSSHLAISYQEEHKAQRLSRQALGMLDQLCPAMLLTIGRR